MGYFRITISSFLPSECNEFLDILSNVVLCFSFSNKLSLDYILFGLLTGFNYASLIEFRKVFDTVYR
jgi:hypothetical protein